MKPTCPRCFSDEKTIPILRGFPDDELFEAAKRGEIFLDGCLVSPGQQPTHFCKNCRIKFDPLGNITELREDEYPIGLKL